MHISPYCSTFTTVHVCKIHISTSHQLSTHHGAAFAICSTLFWNMRTAYQSTFIFDAIRYGWDFWHVVWMCEFVQCVHTTFWIAYIHVQTSTLLYNHTRCMHDALIFACRVFFLCACAFSEAFYTRTMYVYIILNVIHIFSHKFYHSPVHMHKFTKIAASLVNVITLNCVAFPHWIFIWIENFVVSISFVDWLTLLNHIQQTKLFAYTKAIWFIWGDFFLASFRSFFLSCRYLVYVLRTSFRIIIMYVFLEFICIAHHWQSSTVNLSFIFTLYHFFLPEP